MFLVVVVAVVVFFYGKPLSDNNHIFHDPCRTYTVPVTLTPLKTMNKTKGRTAVIFRDFTVLVPKTMYHIISLPIPIFRPIRFFLGERGYSDDLVRPPTFNTKQMRYHANIDFHECVYMTSVLLIYYQY